MLGLDSVQIVAAANLKCAFFQLSDYILFIVRRMSGYIAIYYIEHFVECGAYTFSPIIRF